MGRRRQAKRARKQLRPHQRSAGRGPLRLYRLVPVRMNLRSMLSPVRRIEGRVYAKSSQGSPVFGNLFLVLIALRAARQAAKRKPEVLAIDRLEPGQGLRVITAKPPRRGLSTRQRQRGVSA
jgi:hypothetical protein